MLRPIGTGAVASLLLLTGCFGFWIHTPGAITDMQAEQQAMREDLANLAEAVAGNETLLRGLQAQSGSRTAELVERLVTLATEMDLALSRMGSVGVQAVQDTLAGPDAQLVYDEAYMQFQQGSFEIAAQGFLEVQRDHPSSALADDAMYYTGICWDEQGNAHQAIEDLVALYYLYPSSEWAPGALFRAADIYRTHGVDGDSERLFELLLTEYPGSDEAALVRAQQ
jgi:TolA-binding protein